MFSLSLSQILSPLTPFNSPSTTTLTTMPSPPYPSPSCCVATCTISSTWQRHQPSESTKSAPSRRHKKPHQPLFPSPSSTSYGYASPQWSVCSSIPSQTQQQPLHSSTPPFSQISNTPSPSLSTTSLLSPAPSHGYYSQPGAPCQKGGKKILERVAVESLSDYYHGHTHPLRVHPISPPRQPFHYTQ